jgi:hypothetical protein
MIASLYQSGSLCQSVGAGTETGEDAPIGDWTGALGLAS